MENVSYNATADIEVVKDFTRKECCDENSLKVNCFVIFIGLNVSISITNYYHSINQHAFGIETV